MSSLDCTLIAMSLVYQCNPSSIYLKHYLAGQMFEDELDLAYAVMAGVDRASRKRGIDIIQVQKIIPVLRSNALSPMQSR
jgi:hypothetical protein